MTPYPHETKREFEKRLRDVGCSRKEALRIASGFREPTLRDVEEEIAHFRQIGFLQSFVFNPKQKGTTHA